MNAGGWTLLAAYLAALLALAWPLAHWIGVVMDGRMASLTRLEAPLWRAAGVRADQEMGWLRYCLGLLVFNVLGLFALYVPPSPRRRAAAR